MLLRAPQSSSVPVRFLENQLMPGWKRFEHLQIQQLQYGAVDILAERSVETGASVADAEEPIQQKKKGAQWDDPMHLLAAINLARFF